MRLSSLGRVERRVPPARDGRSVMRRTGCNAPLRIGGGGGGGDTHHLSAEWKINGAVS